MARVAFLVLGLACIAYGVSLGAIGALMTWLGFSFCVVALAYQLGSARLLGKRANGTFHPAALLVHAPFLGANWLAWQLRRARRPVAFTQIAEGLFLGRMATPAELPPGPLHVVDLTCELAPPRAVRSGRYTCLPTLDGSAPNEAAFWVLVDQLASEQGPHFIHCAAGRGRSATLVAAVLLARKLAPDARGAEALLKALRPEVSLSPSQRALLEKKWAG